jgi:hypothetical protein
MSIEKSIIRFEPNGPAGAGLPAMELDPADFQSELPDQHLHVYFEDEEVGLSAGVWTTTDMQEVFGPYPGDEFMWVLEGRVAMLDGNGTATHIKQGETFCLHNGVPTSWKQVGFLRKYFMTYDNPNAPTPVNDSAGSGVVVLDAVALQSGMEQINKEPPLQHENIAFTNDAGNMFAGMWDSMAFEGEMKPFPWYEFAQILNGEVTITEGDGTIHQFGAGDAFFIPEGTLCSWKTHGYVKKLYSIVDLSA